MKDLFACISAFLLSASLSFDACADSPDRSLDIAGGTAHLPVMTEAARALTEADPRIRVTVMGGGSGAGIRKVGEGVVQIGNTGRAPTPAEVERYGLVSFPFAIDGVAAAVSNDNPVSELTKDRLKAIFSGEIKNWKDVGGKDAGIHLFAREDGSGTRETFEERALDNSPVSPDAIIVSSNGAMKTAVGNDPDAIGYVSIGHLDRSVKGVILDGIVPSQKNAASGAYSVTRHLYMNTKGIPEGLTKIFIDYIYSDEGKAITAKAGYIPTDRK